ncbi:MAG TPA: hypothetical protein VL523_11715 [Terriglobia bacterium]|nr:hypothetical protein [Terriglobia bacterium]
MKKILFVLLFGCLLFPSALPGQEALSGGASLTGQANLLPVFAGSQATQTIAGQEGRSWSLAGSTVEFPATDAAIYSCSATGGATCPTVSNLHLQPDFSSSINHTILVMFANDGVALSSANRTLTMTFSLYVDNAALVALRINGTAVGGQCTDCVTGDASVVSTHAVCSANTTGVCTAASPGFISSSVSTCTTGAGHCPAQAQTSGAFTRGVKYFTTLTVVMNSGTTGTVTPASVGIHAT